MFNFSLTLPSMITVASSLIVGKQSNMYLHGPGVSLLTVLLLFDLGRLTHRPVHLETSFRLGQVGSEEGVDHGRLS